MNDVGSLVGALVWVAVVGAFLAHRAWAAQARRREGERSCIRCGSALPPQGGHVSTSRKTCATCWARAQRGYRAGSAFFYSLAVLFAVVGSFLVVADVLRGGWSGGLPGAILLIGMTAIPAAAGWAIRHFGAKEQ